MINRNKHNVTDADIMNDVSERASEAELLVPGGLTAREFMLNGFAALDYHYTDEDEAVIDRVFDVLDSNIDIFAGDAVYSLLFQLLKRTLHVKQYADAEVHAYVNSQDFVFRSLQPNIGNMFLNSVDIIDARLNKLRRYCANDDYEHCLSFFSYKAKGYIIMNFDVEESLSALRMIDAYGIDDVLLLEAYIYTMDYHNGKYIDFRSNVNSGPYRDVLRKMIVDNDHSIMRLMFDFLQRVVLLREEVVCPGYSGLNALTHIPFNIVSVDVDAGDFYDEHYRKRQQVLFELNDDANPIRRTMLASLVQQRYDLGYDNSNGTIRWMGWPAFNEYNAITDIAVELMQDKYDANWEELSKAEPVFNASHNGFVYDVFDLLPYAEFPHYLPYMYTARLLSEIIHDSVMTARLTKLLLHLDRLKDLWVKINGNGNGVDYCVPGDDITADKIHTMATMPRRYWLTDGDEYDLKHCFSYEEVYHETEEKIPDSMMTYLRTGKPPEELRDHTWWNIYPYEVVNGELLYDDFLSPDDIVFKLRVPEYEDEWQEFAHFLTGSDYSV